ncbi:MAG: ribosome small subunit-dependent GTPase A [Desulfobulbaceae bacterium]|uniref:Small ribosomal subunit biogenesis GTPase RsgA n=1 Tax=Candidatus Desulfatifera sulfidica TaxID=2841691 RepID=A0A8J6N9U1_9BACT|nr:ribosome small subunit-dependent GTPase A [Candidatus Desulfatifera sulfidica]
MELKELGLDQWFTSRAQQLCDPTHRIARITVVDRGWFMVRNELGELAVQATGKFMYTVKSSSDMPCVGDWVCVDYHDSEGSASIHALLPRKSFLRRKSAGKTIAYQMIAANIDLVFIVQSCHYDFNVSRLERYLVMANDGHVEPLIVLTKTDLVSEAALKQLISEIREAGITTRIIAVSNVTGAGLDQVKESMFPAKTYCLVGSSGVGKSTLINQLTGCDRLKTRTVSSTGEGRHTTVRRQLIVLDHGAMLIDTPGMREVGILRASEEVEENFDDIREISMNCRFSNCRHLMEPGCAVLKALKEGTLQQEHYQNYLKLKSESASHNRAHTDKRRKTNTTGKNGHIFMKRKSKNRK